MSAPAQAATAAVLIGAGGRMGRAIIGVLAEFPQLRLAGALAAAGSAALGRDSGELAGATANGVPLTASLAALLPAAQVVIDFSRAEALPATLAACRAARKALLIGTTGYQASLEREFEAAAREIPLLVAANTSLGVTLLTELARQAAHALPQFAMRVSERHHVHKRDTPSGTALALAQALRSGRGAGAAGVEIPIESRREGDVIGDHTALLHGPGEELFLGHRALDRRVFARGAVAAALWLAPRPPGRYAMRDVLAGKTAT